MKKLFSTILVLSLLFSGNAYSAEFGTFNQKEDNPPKETKKKYLPSDKIVKDHFKNLTVADLIGQYPSDSLQEIYSSDGIVQYVFFIRMEEVKRRVPVICFVTVKSTTCRVP